MAKIKVRHFREKPSGFYFEPSATMRDAGFRPKPLGKNRAEAIAYVEAQNAEWDAIRGGASITTGPSWPHGTLGHLVDDLRRSAWYGDKAPVTIDEFELALKPILQVFGPSFLTKVRGGDIEKFYTALRAQRSVHGAAKIMKWLRFLFEQAVRHGLISHNPTRVVRIRKPRPRRTVWEPGQVELAIRVAWRERQYGAAVAIAIAYDTSLRPGDIRKLPAEAFTRESVSLVTSKTGTPATLPLWPETVQLIDRYKAKLGAIPLPGQPLLRTRRGQPFTKDHLAKIVRRILRKAGIPDEIQFRDLRRTATVERAQAGATAAEMASATTHSIARSAGILDRYAPPGYSLAKAAQDKRRAAKENKE